jgi:hypothetical protein
MKRGEARATLRAIGKRPVLVLKALRYEVGLSDFVLSRVVDRSAQTVRRWRTGDNSVDIPDAAAAALEDLRAIVAMLVAADYDGDTIRSFLLSRNMGLGQDRPLDGVRVGVSAFRKVEHVTECFIAGIAPEPGPALITDDDEQLEPTLPEPPTPEPSLPSGTVGSRGS